MRYPSLHDDLSNSCLGVRGRVFCAVPCFNKSYVGRKYLFGAAALPAGYLGDKWGAINMMVVFFFGTGLSAILVGLADNQIQIVLSFALAGFFGSIYHPVGLPG